MGKQNSAIVWAIFIIVVVFFTITMTVKYNSLSKDIRLAKVQNVASDFTSSSASNYVQRKAKSSQGVSILNCKDVVKLSKIALPDNYQITDQSIKPGDVVMCNITEAGVGTIQFNVMGIN